MTIEVRVYGYHADVEWDSVNSRAMWTGKAEDAARIVGNLIEAYRVRGA